MTTVTIIRRRTLPPPEQEPLAEVEATKVAHVPDRFADRKSRPRPPHPDRVRREVMGMFQRFGVVDWGDGK
jgi:hypothetical protein